MNPAKILGVDDILTESSLKSIKNRITETKKSSDEKTEDRRRLIWERKYSMLIVDAGCTNYGKGGTLSHAFAALAKETLEGLKRPRCGCDHGGPGV